MKNHRDGMRQPMFRDFCGDVNKQTIVNMGVSQNRGIPKSSIFIGFSHINQELLGTPISGNLHMGQDNILFERVELHVLYCASRKASINLPATFSWQFPDDGKTWGMFRDWPYWNLKHWEDDFLIQQGQLLWLICLVKQWTCLLDVPHLNLGISWVCGKPQYELGLFFRYTGIIVSQILCP